MQGREPLSVAIITLDEERNLGRCLSSVSWADDLVVVDAGSIDRTRKIATRFRARVYDEPWEGFVAAKNRAVAHTRHTWVLSLDADEWLTPAAAGEVRRALVDPQAGAYELRRRPAFCGAFLRRVWNPDRQIRLFRKDLGRFEGGRVHESVRLAEGTRVLRLKEPIPHLTYRTLDEYVVRMNRYTTLAAESLVERGRRTSTARMLVSPPATFIRQYLLKGGFLDGRRGLVASVGSSFYVFLKYAKLWEARRRRDPELERLAAPTPEDPDPAGP